MLQNIICSLVKNNPNESNVTEETQSLRKNEFPHTFAVGLWWTSLDLLVWGLQNAKLKVFLSVGLLEAVPKED